ncbi:uncharacterized protein Z519_00591 [Cladophialophora bantiana CBS 173.52]|uniref:Uncharacterized protein n=1 Tax=Cladophialophora bantiana (strain ATCC 10958 / CBS 173.52 / CDC B-1940 / NIH 8579) TaxID=1442370 RepID=A0A0D2HZP6_CLAB1|nr:uncharacterized protein Z519_00591 [Cladophialophora bantiana CBS 173.52]KIW98928.1 hypothetical protein Z519_00591 [Cladophialophora bantiana CBS 173.52]
MSLAQDGLYCEARHFATWVKERTTETDYLEKVISDITGRMTVPISEAVFSRLVTSVGACNWWSECVTCEELFTSSNRSKNMAPNGVEVIVNSSASHAELRKLNNRLSLIQDYTRKLGVPSSLLSLKVSQKDESENEISLTHDEFSAFRVLWKVEKFGPQSCYLKLLVEWQYLGCGPLQIATKAMRFFRFYAMNRYKSTIVTPNMHMSAYNPDNNHLDLEQFLYDIGWPWQLDKSESTPAPQRKP